MIRRFALCLSGFLVLGLALMSGLAAALGAPQLHLAAAPVTINVRDIDYLQIDGKTFQATVYQPAGAGPFPVILDVHGGAWVREDVRRNEHELLAKALAGMGLVVVSIDYRQGPQNHYPDSIVDVNYAMRWLRANAATFNGSASKIGALGSSSGGHLVLLDALRPDDPRYATRRVEGVASDGARPDYVIVVYPISDPLARRAYAQGVGNNGPVKATDIYFSPAGSLQDGNPQQILDRHEPVTLPPMLLVQGGADASGVVKDQNVSPAIQERFVASYRAAGGKVDFVLLPGVGHNFVNKGGPDLDRAVGLIRPFIEQQLARQ
jgi:acetyl esterase/lipase